MRIQEEQSRFSLDFIQEKETENQQKKQEYMHAQEEADKKNEKEKEAKRKEEDRKRESENKAPDNKLPSPSKQYQIG